MQSICSLGVVDMNLQTNLSYATACKMKKVQQNHLWVAFYHYIIRLTRKKIYQMLPING